MNKKARDEGVDWAGVDWIDMVQGRDKWRALANSVVKLRVP